jgi:hypothetical protein
MEKKIRYKGYEEIFYNGEQFCSILRDDFESESLIFFTKDDVPQQIGFLPHKKGRVIIPHIHNELKREVLLTNEVLLVKKGTVKVNFYCGEQKFIGSEIIKKGDVIHLMKLGHGFEILEDAILIEVKQGPYLGMDDKVRFKGIENDTSK